jgi:hypothetical protein
VQTLTNRYLLADSLVLGQFRSLALSDNKATNYTGCYSNPLSLSLSIRSLSVLVPTRILFVKERLGMKEIGQREGKDEVQVVLARNRARGVLIWVDSAPLMKKRSFPALSAPAGHALKFKILQLLIKLRMFILFNSALYKLFSGPSVVQTLF